MRMSLLQVVGKVSLAAKGLCLWVRAMETYGTVAKDVAPKRNKLKTAQDNLSKKQTALAAAQTQLAEVLAKVQALKVRLHLLLTWWVTRFSLKASHEFCPCLCPGLVSGH